MMPVVESEDRRRLTSAEWLRSHWFQILCLLACAVLFCWAAGRGFDVGDEAYFLLWAAAPYSFRVSATEFAYVWHPLYLAVGGDIALFRIAGVIVLGLSGAIFGLAVARLASLRVARSYIVIALVTAVLWVFEFWEPTPNYNELNLCGLLLLFAGILFASRDDNGVSATSALVETIAPSILAGAGLAIVALGKPTTCLIALTMSLAWVALVRPRKPILCLVVAAIAAMTVITVSILAIDGSFFVFFERKRMAFEFFSLRSGSGDVHGVWRAVIGPLEEGRRWKIAPALASCAIILTVSTFLFALELFPNRLRALQRRVLRGGLIILLGALVATARAYDVGGAVLIPALHAWHYSLLLMLVAMSIMIFGGGLIDWRAQLVHRRIAAVGIITLVPLAYSIGTDVPVIRHMAQASVFWAASTVLLATLLPDILASQSVRTIGAFVGTATLCAFCGLIAAPGPVGHPLWEETVPVELGPLDSPLKVDVDMAAYVRTLRTASVANGFARGTAVIDLSGVGPGLIFVLGGTAPRVPWLADHAIDQRKFSFAALHDRPRAELEGAWVVTAPSHPSGHYAAILAGIGLRFPQNYVAVARTERKDLGWTQVLWKPLSVNTR